MELVDIKAKLETLNRRKQGFERNRNICVLVTAVLIYNMYQAYQSDNPKWFFWVIMGVFVAIAAGIGIYDFIQIKKLTDEAKPLELERDKLEESEKASAEESETDSEKIEEKPAE